MRILHTSDWHIGRSFHGNATLDALSEVLGVLAEQVREHDVDLVLVAGDIFDSATPSAACYPLLTRTLAEIADAGASVVVTSGNHDSAARLGFQAGLLREGVHIVTDPSAVGTPITISDAHGPVHVYGIPYLEPALVRAQWPDVRTQEQALTHAMDLVRADLADRGGRSIAMAHCFAAGVAPTAGLERDIQQGGLDVVPLAAFEGVDYVALGHIHSRQRLSERVRYAGAPLHYNFGEQDKPRGSWLIELAADGGVSSEWLPLPVPRALVTLRGAFADLIGGDASAHAEDWVAIEYTDDLPVTDPMRRAQQVFPYCAAVTHTPARVASRANESYADRVRSARSDGELFDAFLQHVREGEGATERERAYLSDVLDERVRSEALR